MKKLIFIVVFFLVAVFSISCSNIDSNVQDFEFTLVFSNQTQELYDKYDVDSYVLDVSGVIKYKYDSNTNTLTQTFSTNDSVYTITSNPKFNIEKYDLGDSIKFIFYEEFTYGRYKTIEFTADNDIFSNRMVKANNINVYLYHKDYVGDQLGKKDMKVEKKED